MITIPNVLASINPASLPTVGGLPALDLQLLDDNFNALAAVQTPITKTGNYSVSQADTNNILVANSASPLAFTLISGLTAGSWFFVKNIGAGVLTLACTLDGAASPTMNQYDQAFVYTNGTNWFGKITTVNPGTVGEIRMWGGSASPSGWMICQGAVISRTTYAALFAVIGVAYGSGDGSTTFAIPNFCARFPMGVGQGNTAEGGGLGTDRVRGSYGGIETHVQTSSEMPAHTHNSAPGYIPGNSGGGGKVPIASGGTVENQVTSSTGSSNPMSLMNPFMVVNFIIKY